MHYTLPLNDSERTYLLATVEATLIADAARFSPLDPKKNADEHTKAREALHTGAAILAALSPQRLEVAPAIAPAALSAAALSRAQVTLDATMQAEAERLARIIPDFDVRALDPRCIHGVRFAEPCADCETCDTDLVPLSPGAAPKN